MSLSKGNLAFQDEFHKGIFISFLLCAVILLLIQPLQLIGNLLTFDGLNESLHHVNPKQLICLRALKITVKVFEIIFMVLFGIVCFTCFAYSIYHKLMVIINY